MQAQPHYTGLTQTLYFYLERMFLGYRETPQILTNWGQSLFGLAKYTEITEGDFGVQ